MTKWHENEELAEIREIIEMLNEDPSIACDPDTCSMLADSIEKLDKWLSNGGFLPDGWHKARHQIKVGDIFRPGEPR